MVRASSRSSSSSSKIGTEIETPFGPVQRDALHSLSPAQDPQLQAVEPKWPKEWRAYTCLFGGFLLMFNSWGIVNAYGTYSSFYREHLLPNADSLLLNLIGSTQSFMVLLLSAPVGRFLDAGYSRHLIITGTVLVSLGSFLISVSAGDGEQGEGNYGLLWLTQGFISGLGMACFFVSSSQVVATWFKAKKGFAIGIVASGASIAGLIYPMMVKYLIVQVGFNDSTRYVAAVTTFTAIIAILIARPNPEHIIRKPEKWTFTVFIDVHAFKNTPFAFLCAAISFLFFGFYAVFFNLEEWAATEGLGYPGETPPAFDIHLNPSRTGVKELKQDAIRTFYLLSIMNGSSTLGRLASSYLCDHLGALNVHCVVTYVGSLLVLILWTLTKTVNSAIAFVVVFGVFSGAVIGLPPASVAHILGKSPEGQSKLGQWTGMMYSCAAIPALTGPVIAGHLVTEFGNRYITVQLWSGACMFISASCMAAAIYFKRRDDQRAWTAGPAKLRSAYTQHSSASADALRSRAQSAAPSTREPEKSDDEKDKEADDDYHRRQS